jgi:hypothetical protein
MSASYYSLTNSLLINNTAIVFTQENPRTKKFHYMAHQLNNAAGIRGHISKAQI